VTGFYDPLLAKIIVHGASRADAIHKLGEALAATRVHGIETNLDYLATVLTHPAFAAGHPTTRMLDSHAAHSPRIEIIEPGTMSTLQDWPGRLGLWVVGIPPSGPMDALAFRLANRLVGNPEGTAAIEMTVAGMSLRFTGDATIVLTGGAMEAHLDGDAVPHWEPVKLPSGATLRIGAISGGGQRCYLALRGGFDLPDYMGSQATFTLGRFGGHGGRALRSGDVLRMPRDDASCTMASRSGARRGSPRPCNVSSRNDGRSSSSDRSDVRSRWADRPKRGR
jgi:urea carboxylase